MPSCEKSLKCIIPFTLAGSVVLAAIVIGGIYLTCTKVRASRLPAQQSENDANSSEPDDPPSVEFPPPPDNDIADQMQNWRNYDSSTSPSGSTYNATALGSGHTSTDTSSEVSRPHYRGRCSSEKPAGPSRITAALTQQSPDSSSIETIRGKKLRANTAAAEEYGRAKLSHKYAFSADADPDNIIGEMEIGSDTARKLEFEAAVQRVVDDGAEDANDVAQARGLSRTT